VKPSPARLRRRRLFRGLILLIAGLGCLAGAEVVLRVKELRRAASRDRDAWHVFDPVLGWRAKPGYVGQGSTPDPGGVTFAVRINAQGWREDRPLEAAPPEGLARVCLVGDSFTFAYGCEVEDGCAPQLERSLGGAAQVLNLGTCAFGVDQMRLVVEHEALALQPRLVVVGVIHQNFRRALRVISNTGHRKPRFLLEDGALRLTGVPVPEPPEPGSWTYGELPPGGGSFVGWKLRAVTDRARVALAGGSEAARERWLLGQALLRDTARLCGESGVRFAVVLYPTRDDLAEDSDPLRELLAGLEPDLAVLDLYPLFAAAPDPDALFLSDGHPSPAGQSLMAQGMAEFIHARGLLEPR
jgi:hypothetical protein